MEKNGYYFDCIASQISIEPSPRPDERNLCFAPTSRREGFP